MTDSSRNCNSPPRRTMATSRFLLPLSTTSSSAVTASCTDIVSADASQRLARSTQRAKDAAGKYLESVGLIGHSLGTPFLFKKLFDSFAALTDGVGLPRAIDATGVGLIQRRSAVDVKPDDESANAEGTSATALGVLLLNTRNISSDIPAEPTRELRAGA